MQPPQALNTQLDGMCANHALHERFEVQRVTLKQDLFLSTAMQRPHVRLTIRKGTAVHVVEATLTAEGNRSYKLDGKLKTGAQIKVHGAGC